MFILFLLALTCAKTLVVLDDSLKYSLFLGDLRDRGHDLEIREKPLDLFKFDENIYQNVLVLSKVESFGGALKVGNLIDFVNQGGNVFLAIDEITDAIRDFAIEFSVDFEETGTIVEDLAFQGSEFIHADVGFNAQAFTKVENPILFKGIGHKLSGKNDLILPVLVGSATSFTSKKEITLKSTVGKSNVLVSAFQALNGARVVFSGSAAMFSDDVFLSKEVNTGNREFAKDISKWAFGEKNVLRIDEWKHHRQGEEKQHGIYRIKDDMEYSIKISELKDGKWIPYIADDVQFEAIMLDPYVRRNMTCSKGVFTSKFKLPDHYGVFTFKVDYRRYGYTYLEQAETVQVRPYRHNQYPRFLLVAYPYYANIFSLFIGFFAFSLLVLYNREPISKAKKTE